jgi:hypothetical protein
MKSQGIATLTDMAGNGGEQGRQLGADVADLERRGGGLCCQSFHRDYSAYAFARLVVVVLVQAVQPGRRPGIALEVPSTLSRQSGSPSD